MYIRDNKKRLFSTVLCNAALLNTRLSTATPVVSYSVSNQLPPVAYVDEEYSFEISDNTMLSSINSDEDITYKAFNMPSWLSFDGTSFSGKPGSSDFSGSSASVEDISITLQGYDSSDDSYLNTSISLGLMKSAVVSVSDSFSISTFLSDNGETTGSNGYIITPGKEFSLQFSSSDFESSLSSLSYGAKMSDGNSPLPIWFSFDSSSLTFSGTAPAVNSDIAAAQSYPVVLYATSEDGFSMAEIDFSLVVGAHSLSIQDADISINTTSSSLSFTYSLDMSNIKLDGDTITQDNVSSASLSSDAPSWVSLSSFGDLNYVLSGTAPSDFSGSENFEIEILDTYSDEVNFNVEIRSVSVKTTSSTSSTSTLQSSRNTTSSTTHTSSSANRTSSSILTSFSSSGIITTTLSPTSITTTYNATATTSATAYSTASIKDSNHKKNKHTTAIVCGVVIPVVVIIILILLFLFFMRRRNNKSKTQATGGSKPNGGSTNNPSALEKAAPLALAATTTHSSDISSPSNYEKMYDKSTNDINAEALNDIPTAVTAAELDQNLKNFLQDSSHTEGDIGDSSNTTNSTSLYSPIRHSQSSLENQNIYYQSMKNKGKESWRNITETEEFNQQEASTLPIPEEQIRISSKEDPLSINKKSDRSDNRSSYHTLNSIDTDEFMAMDLNPHGTLNVDENSHRKTSLLNVRDSVFLSEQDNDNTITIEDNSFKPDLSKTNKSSVLVSFENVDSSVTKGDITDGHSIETASL
ncbi:hypothetical protein QEN19_004336 [Hanseniaspora menglaensis]